jgi:hypothetical protein
MNILNKTAEMSESLLIYPRKNPLFEADYDVTELAIQVVIRLAFGSRGNDITNHSALLNQSVKIVLVL